ncbi:phosphate/phosphite/phosphonate ABC transporter substrate-binding protein [Nesterenkonia alba]|uniref:phosphate/phosphite/phosphonate ABC transporter substrate-binding protein n=1 Tax=Nesterenkonia alba TaxID=515814 RepID=UPI0003B43A85|nr:phosphate/phosphite/phosphonate ABC transporter substrate-binding protein [Nesterenkonia alba]
MRTTTKSAFALASVLTLALTACAGDEEDVTTDDDDDDVADTDEDNGTDDTGDDDADAGSGIESVDEIVIGLVPSTEAAAAEEEAADEIAEQLSEALGGHPVAIDVADSYVGVIQGMQSGDIHLVMSGPIGLIQAEEEANATPILQSIRHGSDLYVTQWFTNDPDTYCVEEEPEEIDGYLFCNGITPDSEPGPLGEAGLEAIEDGTPVAYVEEGSASGFYFPQTQLNELGVEVDAQFAGSHDAAVENVYNGEFPIGTSFDDARGNIEEDYPDVGEQVVVFAWAGPIPNDGIVAADVFSDEELEIITEAWLSFGEEVEVADEDEGTEGDPLYQVYEIEGLVEADLEALDLAREVYHEFGDDE